MFRGNRGGTRKTPVSYTHLVNRMKYRALLKDSLDQIFATEYKNMKDCIESKVFGIGLESYTAVSYTHLPDLSTTVLQPE